MRTFLSRTRGSSRNKRDRETSAGGIVFREGRLLMVQVKNQEGLVVWTFPKGHLEKGETAEQAAAREVWEETGWQCAVRRGFGTVRYRFSRDDRQINKVVHWFLMDPLRQEGKPDPNEILDSRWFLLEEADDLVNYESDRKILARLRLKKSVNR